MTVPLDQLSKPHGAYIDLEASVPTVDNGGGKVLDPNSFVLDFTESIEAFNGYAPGMFTIVVERACYAVTPEEWTPSCLARRLPKYLLI
mmetsp:Transcript_17427/g.44463  ORF Transcript_17427/g.44463 Transcript_17427/m.44463 type:complete len:89 (+) Transcript_17427:876-1142(+)